MKKHPINLLLLCSFGIVIPLLAYAGLKKEYSEGMDGTYDPVGRRNTLYLTFYTYQAYNLKLP